jgi:macrodomain Ter protein organizer (MatP/YcbG family)
LKRYRHFLLQKTHNNVGQVSNLLRLANFLEDKIKRIFCAEKIDDRKKTINQSFLALSLKNLSRVTLSLGAAAAPAFQAWSFHAPL